MERRHALANRPRGDGRGSRRRGGPLDHQDEVPGVHPRTGLEAALDPVGPADPSGMELTDRRAGQGRQALLEERPHEPASRDGRCGRGFNERDDFSDPLHEIVREFQAAIVPSRPEEREEIRTVFPECVAAIQPGDELIGKLGPAEGEQTSLLLILRGRPGHEVSRPCDGLSIGREADGRRSREGLQRLGPSPIEPAPGVPGGQDRSRPVVVQEEIDQPFAVEPTLQSQGIARPGGAGFGVPSGLVLGHEAEDSQGLQVAHQGLGRASLEGDLRHLRPLSGSPSCRRPSGALRGRPGGTGRARFGGSTPGPSSSTCPRVSSVRGR